MNTLSEKKGALVLSGLRHGFMPHVVGETFFACRPPLLSCPLLSAASVLAVTQYEDASVDVECMRSKELKGGCEISIIYPYQSLRSLSLSRL